MRERYEGDPGYPAGAEFDSRAPWNERELADGEFVCDRCGEVRSKEDFALDIQSEPICERCAQRMGLNECQDCGTWGDSEAVYETFGDRGIWRCVPCAVAASYAVCTGCGELHEAADVVDADGERLCSGCRVGVETPALPARPLPPVIEGVFRGFFPELFKSQGGRR